MLPSQTLLPPCPVQPSGSWVAVKLPRRAAQVGGVLLPEAAQERASYGMVWNIGPKCEFYRPGDIVVFSRHAAEKVEYERFSKREKAKEHPTLMMVEESMIFHRMDREYAEDVLGLRISDIEGEEVPLDGTVHAA